MKKILITGCSGFIGAEIINQLYGRGEWVITVLEKLLGASVVSSWALFMGKVDMSVKTATVFTQTAGATRRCLRLIAC